MDRYSKYVDAIEDTNPIMECVADLDGNLYDLSGDLAGKLKSIEKSRLFWGEKLNEKPCDERASKFYKKFNHLQEQVLLFIEGKNAIKQSPMWGQFQ